MLESVLAAALGATATAAAGSLLVNSDRLRQGASLDASLLDALEKDPGHKQIADVVKESMVRSAAVAAIRSTRPALTLSEASALAISMIGTPAYIALLAAFPTWLAATMAIVVTLFLTVLYWVTTRHWYRRAAVRIEVYKEAGLDDDAGEADRQADLAIAAQAVVASFSLMLSCLMIGDRLDSGDVGDGFLATVALAVAVSATYGARRAARSSAQSG